MDRFGMRRGLRLRFLRTESGGNLEAGPRASVSFGDNRAQITRVSWEAEFPAQ